MADVLGKLIYDGPYMVNYFDLQSSNARGGWGLLSSSGARPSYDVYQLYSDSVPNWWPPHRRRSRVGHAR